MSRIIGMFWNERSEMYLIVSDLAIATQLVRTLRTESEIERGCNSYSLGKHEASIEV